MYFKPSPPNWAKRATPTFRRIGGQELQKGGVLPLPTQKGQKKTANGMCC